EELGDGVEVNVTLPEVLRIGVVDTGGGAIEVLLGGTEGSMYEDTDELVEQVLHPPDDGAELELAAIVEVILLVYEKDCGKLKVFVKVGVPHV
ncbi:hypothetical protein KC353_g22282, partial [Hortaea werneckii]